MNFKRKETDSGSYVNGVYTTKNGFSGSGLNCPKGGRLYDPNIRKGIFFEPEDTAEGEEFRKLTQDVCPGIMPYYAISNYGRLLNIYSGRIMKPNYRPNGYEYYCLAAEGTKTNQKKYSTNRMVMMIFEPIENPEEMQVNHKNGDKTQNYINKLMEDGTIYSNLEWMDRSENIQHSHDTGLNHGPVLNMEKATHIRKLKEEGYSYSRIREEFYPEVSGTAIQMVCKNKLHFDPKYRPRKHYTKLSYMNADNNNFKLSDFDAYQIRTLAENGYRYFEIKEKFYPNVSIGTISDIVRRKTHNRF